MKNKQTQSGVGVGVAGRSALLFGGVTDEPAGAGKTKPRFEPLFIVHLETSEEGS